MKDYAKQLEVLILAIEAGKKLTCYTDGGDVMIYDDEIGAEIYVVSEYEFIDDVCEILGIERGEV
jgi:hypothetical protein